MKEFVVIYYDGNESRHEIFTAEDIQAAFKWAIDYLNIEANDIHAVFERAGPFIVNNPDDPRVVE